MSGCCCCSCLLRTTLCLPSTFSLVQKRGQLASYVCVPWHLCVHAILVCAPVRVFFSLVSMWCTVDTCRLKIHLCIVYTYVYVSLEPVFVRRVWREQFCYRCVIDWRLGSSVARGLTVMRSTGLAKLGPATQTSPTVLLLRICEWAVFMQWQCLAGSGGWLL